MTTIKVPLMLVLWILGVNFVLYGDSLFLPEDGGVEVDQEGGQKYSFNQVYNSSLSRSESGSFENGIWTVRGTYYVEVDDYTYAINYLADDKGYRIVGAQLLLVAAAPPISDAAKKALLNST